MGYPSPEEAPSNPGLPYPILNRPKKFKSWLLAGQVVDEKIHPVWHANFRDKAQRPSDVRFTTLFTAYVFDELSAQLNLTRQPKGTRPHLKHVLKPKPHAKKGESQALRAAVQPTTSTG